MAKDTRTCELCKTKFNTKEKLISLKHIFKKTCKFFYQDKYRVLKVGLYFLYLYVYFKRSS
jgi:hypothetical protein